MAISGGVVFEIRPERPGDKAEIKAVNDEAFARVNESDPITSRAPRIQDRPISVTPYPLSTQNANPAAGGGF